MQKRAADAGVTLDVGDFPERDTAGTPDSDPERIAKLTAHAVARVGDHFSFIRRMSRHLEGQEKRAGLLSDVVAVIAAVYRRNPTAVEDLAKQFATELQSRRAAQAATKNGGAHHDPSSPMTHGKPKPGGVPHA